VNLADIREEVAWLVGFKSSQVSQDFRGPAANTNKRLDSAINQGRRLEYNHAVAECGHAPFEAAVTITWESDDQDLELPGGLTRDQIIALYNMSTGERGTVLLVGSQDGDNDIVWLDRKTLRWGSSGPGADTEVKFQHIARPNNLVEDGDECDLIPAVYHDIYVWSAGIVLRTISDEAAPSRWVAHREELREDLIAHLGRSRPRVGGVDSNVFQNLGERSSF
jgi:hypothetical protein